MNSLFDHDFRHYAAHFLIVLAVSFFATGYLLPRLRPAGDAAFKTLAHDVETAYANDTSGGKTPNETIDLFIRALEAGDADLAASYFLPEYQAKKRGEFLAGKSSGGVALLLRVLRLKRREVALDGGSSQIEFYGDDDEASLVADLVLNTASGRWKIVRM